MGQLVTETDSKQEIGLELSKSQIRKLSSDYVIGFFRENKLVAFFSALVFILNGVFNIALSWYLQIIFDNIMGEGPFTFFTLIIIFIIYIGFYLIISATNYLAYPKFLARAIASYKNKSFAKLLEKNLASFSQESTSDYISAFTNDVTRIETNYLKGVFRAFTFVIQFFGAFALMIYYSSLLTLIAVLLSALPFLASMFTGNKLAKKEELVSVRNAAYLGNVQDILDGFTVVKSFQAEAEVEGLFNKSNQSLESAKLERERLSTLLNSIGALASFIAQLGVMLTGAYMVKKGYGRLTPGMIMAFTNLMNFVLQPIAQMPPLLANMKSARHLIAKLAYKLEQNVRDKELVIDQEHINHISFQDVSFGYGDKLVLDKLNLQLEGGKSYALVGASGSGKSTMLNLLLGTSDNYQGKITLDEYELSEVNTDSLYNHIALIQQNVFIFNATIEDNITMFRDFPKEDLDRVVKLSGLDQLIDERGVDFKCGENGNKLSGGERQRVAIARALLKDSSVLLVDEATSSLDNETAYNITQAMLDLEGITRIMVTHRLDFKLLEQYDSIIALKDGRVIEQGSFEELMGLTGYFYSLYVISQ